tara:strand:- start:330 stop:479 length:150 start_codon:yes stop_codon:yes gene_type:complete
MNTAEKLLNIFSEYLDDVTLEEFFDDDCGLTKQGQELLNDINNVLGEGV